MHNIVDALWPEGSCDSVSLSHSAVFSKKRGGVFVILVIHTWEVGERSLTRRNHLLRVEQERRRRWPQVSWACPRPTAVWPWRASCNHYSIPRLFPGDDSGSGPRAGPPPNVSQTHHKKCKIHLKINNNLFSFYGVLGRFFGVVGSRDCFLILDCIADFTFACLDPRG